MALSIKNLAAKALARQRASVTGESVTQAVTTALNERLDRIEASVETELQAKTDRIMSIASDAGPRWSSTSLDHGELLYDESGLPR